MFNMRNKDKVKMTESFAVYLWAFDPAHPDQAYVIAKNESAIRLEEKDFSMGSMVSLFVTPVDTYIIQRHTRFMINFKTVDPIPWNSKIKVRFPTTITLVSGTCKLESGSFPFDEGAHCYVEKNTNTVVLTNPFLPETSYDPLTMGSIKFSFDTGGKNPDFACDAGPFLISTFAIYDGLDYGIDYYFYHARDDKLPRFAPYTPIPDDLKVGVVTTSSLTTYNAPTTYSF